MSLKLKLYLLLLLLSISTSAPFSSGMVEPLAYIKVANKSILKVGGIQMNARKLMTLDVQDYDETKPNNRHEPKKQPGNGKP